MRPCDVKSIHQAHTELREQGISFNESSINIQPNVIYLTIGPAQIRIPMGTFKRFAEWYLTDQNLDQNPDQNQERKQA